jgi:hypothetical protein
MLIHYCIAKKKLPGDMDFKEKENVSPHGKEVN